MSATRAAFDFFSIPAELRNRIYEYALSKKTESEGRLRLQQSGIAVRGYSNGQPDVRWPALLCVNRRMRNEALPIFLSNNTFIGYLDLQDLDDPAILVLGSWLAMLGPERSKFIEKFVLQVGRVPTHESFVPTKIKLLLRAWNPFVKVSKQNLVTAMGLDRYGVPSEAFKVNWPVMGDCTLDFKELADEKEGSSEAEV